MTPEERDNLVKSAIARRDKAWRSVCLRLWPYIRFWGLCGASPDAIEAMMQLGELLKIEQTPAVSASEIADHAREQAIQDVLRLWDEKIAKRVDTRNNARDSLRDEIEQLI